MSDPEGAFVKLEGTCLSSLNFCHLDLILSYELVKVAIGKHVHTEIAGSATLPCEQQQSPQTK